MPGELGFKLDPYQQFVPTPHIFPEGLPESSVPHTWGVKDEDKIPEIWVTVGLGNSRSLKGGEGNYPSVSLWNEKGDRLGQHDGRWSNPLKQGGQKTMAIQQTQNGKKDEDPGYIMLSADDDAICIAMIQVSNSRHSSAFFGDIGYACGQTWYYSSRMMQKHMTDYLDSRCVWLDADHTGGKNARAMSYHLRDMIPSKDKLALYNKDGHKYLCNPTRRYSYWKNLKANGEIPFFDPPLKYLPDSADKSREGTEVDPDLVFDPTNYDKDVYIKQGESKEDSEYHKNNPFKDRMRKRQHRLSKRQGSNMDIERIVVTEIPGQTATEICQHPNSAGYDIVSYEDMKYCDLSERKLYDLCSSSNPTNCFDANSTTFVGVINARGEDSAPVKLYKTKDYWK
ncbi:hypothetical protein CkaCkLH20_01673 [Colletotrichum karsti]|uniref:Uncharacterized protein n=1 Tax=Colletotrichum karsti TaxID=1095194 RepID=A0A9P6IEX1_9PEZI|nr:uncharacterized protein CkaCkLH20_01673 [Colletotrichum karsti]KAF9880631.1 hypothetical protein CkaCkLH20_01673 [Colletotrichum karsti]